MSGVVEVMAAAAMFLAIGGDTEEAMRQDVWRFTGACAALEETGRPCDYHDGSPECDAAWARQRPCVFVPFRMMPLRL